MDVASLYHGVFLFLDTCPVETLLLPLLLPLLLLLLLLLLRLLCLPGGDPWYLS